jgi:hypothetical protein
MRSRFIKTDRRPLPKKPRSKKVFGSFEDSNRWIRCWNCNALLDTEGNRTLSGDTDGNIYSEVIIQNDISVTGSIIMELTGNTVLMKVDGGGNALPIYTPHTVTTPRGCWRCGTTNLP